MNKKYTNIPPKILNIKNVDLKLKRLSLKLNSFLNYFNIHIIYKKLFTIKYFNHSKESNFCKFTGKTKIKFCYKIYKILYYNKYLQSKLNFKKNIYFTII